MKAFVITEPNKFFLMEVPKPEPADDEVLIKVAAAGFCGTDIHTFHGKHPTVYPLIPGHEFSGIIEKAGSLVTDFKFGDKVVVDPNIFCEKCYYCKQNKQIHCENIKVIGNTRDGAFAEYVTAPERCVFSAENIDLIQAAMVEPLSCVINAYNKFSIPVGGSVLIFGAGTIGLMHLMICLRGGASTVTIVDKKNFQLEMAKKLGATHTFVSDENLERNLKSVQRRGFSVVIDATGVPKVVELAILHLAKTGVFVSFGACPIKSNISINPFDLYYNDWKLIGSYALQKSMPQSIAMLAEGKFDLSPLIGKTITIEEMPEQFVAFCEGKTNNKIVVVFSY
jgi:2-desacetyl-2-hydroxyethyl bacteriochlorophyllide A dehydrogenase